eukprot:Gb_12380 [translate_table: standard]
MDALVNMSQKMNPCLLLLVLVCTLFLVVSDAISGNAYAYSNNNDDSSSVKEELTMEAADGNSRQILGPEAFNPKLQQAYTALQAWKRAITSDPRGITTTWVGYDVCKYTGVFCAEPLDKSRDLVVAGIDLNHGWLGGTLVEELGLLADISLLHLNTNRFIGTIPTSFKDLHLLAELDLSNNLFNGPFPTPILAIPQLLYLDLRFNHFQGPVPTALFDKQLDALFLNNNGFDEQIPHNMGYSPASVINFANNRFSGTIPSSIGNAKMLQEILFLNNFIAGCLPKEVGLLEQVRVLDLSFNFITGQVPISLSCLKAVEELNLSHNNFYGEVPQSLCSMKSLKNFTVSYNYFTAEGSTCPSIPKRGVAFDDTLNCIPARPSQRPLQQCFAFAAKPKICTVTPGYDKLPCII